MIYSSVGDGSFVGLLYTLAARPQALFYDFMYKVQHYFGI